MTQQHPSVLRVQNKLHELGILGEVHHLSDSARTAQEAADALSILVGQPVILMQFIQLHLLS